MEFFDLLMRCTVFSEQNEGDLQNKSPTCGTGIMEKEVKRQNTTLLFALEGEKVSAA